MLGYGLLGTILVGYCLYRAHFMTPKLWAHATPAHIRSYFTVAEGVAP